jgi:Tol biopolymer transport system component
MRTEGKLTQVFTMRPDGSDVRRVTSLGGAHPSWAPNGDRIAYVYESNVWTIAPDGSDPRKLTAYDGCTEVSELAWSRDGTTIAFTIFSNDWERGGIAFVPAAGGQVSWRSGPPFDADPNDNGIQASAPAWQPGPAPAARLRSGPSSTARPTGCIDTGGG